MKKRKIMREGVRIKVSKIKAVMRDFIEFICLKEVSRSL
jgi:hypothetical protein